jgi:hypothetical protein
LSAKGRKRKEVSTPPTLLSLEEGVAAAPEKHPEEFFETPAWCVDRLLKHNRLERGSWLEPTAGTGAIIRAVNARRHDVTWTGVELRPEAFGCFYGLNVDMTFGDFLQWRPPLGVVFDVTLGNPPFSLAAEMVSHGLRFSKRLVFLLRLAFIASEDRIPFFRRVGMPDQYVLPDRPSFDGKGTDAADYAWMEFRPEWAGRLEGKTVYMPPDDAVKQIGLGLEA